MNRKGIPRHVVIPIDIRFWEKVDVCGFDECWPWLAGTDDHGYGVINACTTGRARKAHRVSLALTGIDVKGLIVRHTCDNPVCVNPRHLVTGTQADNIADMHERGRSGVTGARSHLSKLTEEQVGEILRLARLGTNNTQLGKMFGVTRTNITAIVKRKSWKHVQV